YRVGANMAAGRRVRHFTRIVPPPRSGEPGLVRSGRLPGRPRVLVAGAISAAGSRSTLLRLAAHKRPARRGGQRSAPPPPVGARSQTRVESLPRGTGRNHRSSRERGPGEEAAVRWKTPAGLAQEWAARW